MNRTNCGRYFFLFLLFTSCGTPVANSQQLNAVQSAQQLAASRGKPYFFEVEQDFLLGQYGGYVPIEVTAKPTNGKVFSRNARLTFCGCAGYFYRPALVASAPLEIVAGESEAKAKVLLPVGIAGSDISWWVESDGNRKSDNRDIISYRPFNNGAIGGGGSTFLFVNNNATSRPPDFFVDGIFRPGNRNRGNPRPANAQDLSKATNLPSITRLADLVGQSYGNGPPNVVLDNSRSFKVIPGKDLPDHWIELSAAQWVVISFADLQSIASKYPVKLEQLKLWVAAGGRLLVNSCGDGYAKAEMIFPLLKGDQAFRANWEYLDDGGMNVANQYGAYGAESFAPDDEVFISNSSEGRSWGNLSGATKDNWKSVDKFPLKIERKNSSSPADRPLVASFGAGLVLAVQQDMSKYQNGDWRSVLGSTIGHVDLSEHVGHVFKNVDSVIGFDIPGVKPPPKTMFQLLIVFFVIVAGPLNYVFLKRIRRLNIIIITMPLISIVACVLLFGYGLLSDGVGTKARQDSFTVLDQRNGVAMSNQIVSAFSGLHPGEQSFEKDNLVYGAKLYDQQNPTYVRISEGSYGFSGGMIQSRKTYQFAITRAFETDVGLRINTKDQVEIVNDFQNEIRLLAINVDGLFFVGESIAPGEQVVLTEWSSTDLQARMLEIRDKLSPLNSQLPAARGQSWGSAFDKLANFSSDKIPPGSYLGIFENFTDVPPYKERLQQSNGMHIVHGVW